MTDTESSGSDGENGNAASEIETSMGRVDANQFIEWCGRQIEQSRSNTSRIINNTDEEIRYRLREEPGDEPEDIVLIKGKSVDTIRFKRGEDTRQFHAHRREITFHGKTMIVRHSNGCEICRAGTGTKNKCGPFPV